jgi:hypothetical protein
MKKYIVLLIAATLMACQIGIVSAGEYYQYFDNEGNMRFTDDFNSIPKEKQSGVKTFQSVVSKPKPSESPQVEADVPPETTVPSDIPETNEEIGDQAAQNDQTDAGPTEDLSETSSQSPDEVETPATETGYETSPEDQVSASSEKESDTSKFSAERPQSMDYQGKTDPIAGNHR